MTFAVGETRVIVVGIEGVVEAADRETVTINGLTLPIRLDVERGIKYLSIVWPEAPDCSKDHCTPVHYDLELKVRDQRAALDKLQGAVTQAHDDHHVGAIRFCADPVCRAVAS